MIISILSRDSLFLSLSHSLGLQPRTRSYSRSRPDYTYRGGRRTRGVRLPWVTGSRAAVYDTCQRRESSPVVVGKQTRAALHFFSLNTAYLYIRARAHLTAHPRISFRGGNWRVVYVCISMFDNPGVGTHL